MSITNPSCSRRYWKKSRANCYTRTDHFFLLTFMRCGWRLCYFWWLRYLRWEENFSLKLFVLQIAASITVPRVRITDIWVKVELRFVSPKRKGVRWKKSFIFWWISWRFESPCLTIFRYQAFFFYRHIQKWYLFSYHRCGTEREYYFYFTAELLNLSWGKLFFIIRPDKKVLWKFRVQYAVG